MTEVFIVDALRTPFGSFGGALADVPAPTLASQVIAELIRRNALPGEGIGEVIVGQVLQGGNGQAPARQAMRLAGLPDGIPAMTINKVCGSGLKAIMLAADGIRLGETDVAIAGGMENMSMAPYALPAARYGFRMGNGQAVDLMIHDGLLDPYSGRHMGEITEDWSASNDIDRAQQDEYAARSYRLALEALRAGTFQEELVPVVKRSRKGEVTVAEDEEPGRGNVEKLPGLRSAFAKEGSITAGNASSINDGAALALVAGEAGLKKYNLTPRARLVAAASYSKDPNLFAEAPVGAIQKCIEKAKLIPGDIGLFEINEAFSGVPLLCMKHLGIPLEKVNVNGGAVALGHPIGASGGRLVATLVREMRQRKVRYGLASLCIGGGEAVAAIFESM